MGQYLSPGVYARERDLTSFTPAVGTSTAALVGYSPRGSLEVNLISNRQQFIEEYGRPDITSSYFHYTALAFLENGTSLYCLRVAGESPLYAGGTIVNNVYGTAHRGHEIGQLSTVFYDDESGNPDNDDELVSIFAKDPGVWGEKISITITDVQALESSGGLDLDDSDTYTFVINVYFTDNEGISSKVESWKVSRQKKIDGYGKQLYLEDKINDFSKYIVVADSTETSTVLPLASDDDTIDDAVALDGGFDGTAGTADASILSNIIAGWDEFANPDNIEVQILLDAGYTPNIAAVSASVASIQTDLIALAEARRDCFAVLGVPDVDNTSSTTILAYRNSTLNANTSFAALYSPWCKINDSFNDKIVEVPPTGYVASKYALNDAVRDVWYAPAGFDRGTLNILGLTKVFNTADRDVLYPGGVNCLQTFRGYGHVIYGQKTLQAKPSALDRVNVRRLLLMVESALVKSLRSFLFEPNSELTRFIVKAQIDEYLERLSAAGAFQDEAGDNGFLVVCDTTNNTPAVIDANELHVDVFIKPSRSAEFIQLQTTITKSGTSFTELISRGTII